MTRQAQPNLTAEAFVDNAKLTTEYAYDANGNMTWDANSKISAIQYNILNLPNVMQFTEGHQNYYTYNASGQKLNLTNYTLNSIVNVPQGSVNPVPPAGAYVKTSTDYIGNMIYENGTLKEILTPEGFIQNGVYFYYVKDHLGNNRVMIGSAMEQSHYYPSGMRFTSNPTLAGNYSAAIPFRLGGKEYEAMNGLNQYDFIARRRYANLPIPTTLDPMCEKTPQLSPYSWCGGNYINNVDPTGMDWYQTEDKKATIWREGNDKTITIQDQTYNNIGEVYTQKIDNDLLMVYHQNQVSFSEGPILDQGTPKEQSFMEKWSNSDNYFAKLSYGFVNDLYVSIQPLTFGLIGGDRVNELTGQSAFVNLDGTTNYKGIDAFINTVTTFIPEGRATKGLGYIEKLNAAQFSRTFKGTLSTMSPASRGYLNNQLNKGILLYNNKISSGGILFNIPSLIVPSENKK